MNPYRKNGLLVPAFTPDGYVITTPTGETICLSPGGDYTGMEFTEVDFSFVAIRANFSRATFRGCALNMTDFSGSQFTDVTFDGCVLASSAFMWTDLANLSVKRSVIARVRFGFSNLKNAHIEAQCMETTFINSTLDGACFYESNLTDCNFLGTDCHDVTISHTEMEDVEFDACDLRWMTIKNSTANDVTFSDSNLSGGTWTSVVSTAGEWRFINSPLTATSFSMCHAENTMWNHVMLDGVVMERCNWLSGEVEDCEFRLTSLTSVGWNETTFTNVIFQDVEAHTLQLRFAKFNNCLFIDSTFANSSWEYCQFEHAETDNFDIVRASYLDGTQWPAGYAPATDSDAST
jgi:uncharacterized protein YjbI with pentapeptide repeats